MKVRIPPNGLQRRRANRVAVGGRRHVHRAAHGRRLASLGVHPAPIRQSQVVHPLRGLAVVLQPALDNLHPVQVRAQGILQGLHHEAGRHILLPRGKIAAHGHPVGVTCRDPIGPFEIRGLKVPAAKEAQAQARPGAGVGLLAGEGSEDGLAGVGLGPDGRVSRSGQFPFQLHDVGNVDERLQGPLGARLMPAKLAPKVVFISRRDAGVGVGAADEAELVGVDTNVLQQRQPCSERRAGVFGGEHRILMGATRAESGETVPGFIVGKLIVWRHVGMGLAVALELGHFQQGLPACPQPCVVRRDGLAVGVGEGEHQPSAYVAVMGDGQRPAASAGLVVGQKPPQLPGPVAIEGTEGHHLSGSLRAVLEDDDAVHVAAAPARRPLITNQGGESTRLVVALRLLGDDLPYRLVVGRVLQQVLAAAQRFAELH